VRNDLVLVLVVITALAFDFTNGFHDTGNAMATSIATGALPPRVAVALSGLLNLVGAFLSLAVAATIASGLVNTAEVTLQVVAASWPAASSGTCSPGSSASRRVPRTRSSEA
jgi:inorganic phosphate transporter, PiT family